MANHVKKRRLQLGLTQQTIADAIGTTKATVMKLERGHMQLTEKWIERLAKPLKCRPQDLVMEQFPESVPLIGEIMPGGQLGLFCKMLDAGLAEVSPDLWEGLEQVERPLEGNYRGTKALRVHGDWAGPLMPNASVVYYAEPVHDGFDDYINQMVVCADNGHHGYLAQLQKANDFGKYALHIPGRDNVPEVQLAWCAKVIFVKLP